MKPKFEKMKTCVILQSMPIFQFFNVFLSQLPLKTFRVAY
eukprot:UN08186